MYIYAGAQNMISFIVKLLTDFKCILYVYELLTINLLGMGYKLFYNEFLVFETDRFLTEIILSHYTQASTTTLYVYCSLLLEICFHCSSQKYTRIRWYDYSKYNQSPNPISINAILRKCQHFHHEIPYVYEVLACDDSTSSSASEVGDRFQELMHIFEAYLIMEIIFFFLLMSHNTEGYSVFVLRVCTSTFQPLN